MAGLEEWLPPPGNWRYKNRLIVRRIPFFIEGDLPTGLTQMPTEGEEYLSE